MNFAIATLASFGKCKEKPGMYSILRLDAMPLSLKNLLLKLEYFGPNLAAS